jgi:translation initiation factor IF-2
MIGGSYVRSGVIRRNGAARLVRDGIVIYEGKIASLRRFKDDVGEVRDGYECGIGLENYQDLKDGDVIEAFEVEEFARTI